MGEVFYFLVLYLFFLGVPSIIFGAGLAIVLGPSFKLWQCIVVVFVMFSIMQACGLKFFTILLVGYLPGWWLIKRFNEGQRIKELRKNGYTS